MSGGVEGVRIHLGRFRAMYDDLCFLFVLWDDVNVGYESVDYYCGNGAVDIFCPTHACHNRRVRDHTRQKLMILETIVQLQKKFESTVL